MSTETTASLPLQSNGPVPLYYQLELRLRSDIAAGVLAPGQELPGENHLAQQFNISRITVRRALERLEEDGLIVRRRGARTTVAPNLPLPQKIERDPQRVLSFEDEMRRLGLDPRARVLEVATGAPPAWVASLLGLRDGEAAVRIERLGLSGGMPLWLESRYHPLDVGEALLETDLSAASIHKLLESDLGLSVSGEEAYLEATIANSRQAQLLRVEVGDPLLLNQSVTFAGGRPVEALRSYMRADSYRIAIRMRPDQKQPGFGLSTREMHVVGAAAD